MSLQFEFEKAKRSYHAYLSKAENTYALASDANNLAQKQALLSEARGYYCRACFEAQKSYPTEGFKLFYTLGKVSEELGDISRARDYYAQCVSNLPADKAIEERELAQARHKQLLPPKKQKFKFGKI